MKRDLRESSTASRLGKISGCGFCGRSSRASGLYCDSCGAALCTADEAVKLTQIEHRYMVAKGVTAAQLAERYGLDVLLVIRHLEQRGRF